jgi:hypothetical protein
MRELEQTDGQKRRWRSVFHGRSHVESLHMIVADYLLAWTAIAAITFGARLFRIPAQQRYAQGVFAKRAYDR